MTCRPLTTSKGRNKCFIIGEISNWLRCRKINTSGCLVGRPTCAPATTRLTPQPVGVSTITYNPVPTLAPRQGKELFRKLNGLHDRDLLQLAADADASIHDSRKHALYQHNAGGGSFPNLFSQSQSQSSHGGAGDAFSKLNAQMHEIQTSFSRVEAKTQKKWNNIYKNKDGGSQQSSRKGQSAPSQSQNSTTTKPEGNPEWCFYHNTCGERARKCKQPCPFNHDSPNVQQLHSKNTSLQHIHLQICKHSTAATVIQGRSQDFSRGGGWSYGSKSLEKERLLEIRIVKESTKFEDKQLTVPTTKTGDPSN